MKPLILVFTTTLLLATLPGCACFCRLFGLDRQPAPASSDAAPEDATPSLDEPAQETEPETVAPAIPTDDVAGFSTVDLTTAEGPAAGPDSRVTLTLTGRVRGGNTFQTISEPAGPWPVRSLIPGLARGVIGMTVGSSRRITIPPELAYGDQPVLDDQGNTLVPPNATLVYEVTLVSLENPATDANASGPADTTEDPAP